MHRSRTPTDGAAAKRRRRRRIRRPREEIVFYQIRVGRWDYYYSFRVSDPKSRFDLGPYSELATLTFSGVVAQPEGLRYKRGELTLSARAGLMDERFEHPPVGIGGLSAYEQTLSAYVFVPVERLAELTALAHSGRIRVAAITGTRLRYRSGTVRAISLSTKADEDDA